VAKVSERATATKAPEAMPAKSAPQKRQSDNTPSCVSPHEYVFNLQRSIGNQGVAQLYRSGLLQAKLRIGSPNDIYEQEADRVADQVMRMSGPAVKPKPT
jgi:hypothetical protein